MRRRASGQAGWRPPARRFHPIHWAAVLALIAMCLPFTAKAQFYDALDPRGPNSSRIADHWWLMFGLGTAVYLAVVILLLVAVFRGRRRSNASDGTPTNDRRFLTVAGFAIPSVILLVLVFDATRTGQAVIDPPETPEVTIEITGHQFWWEVYYPDYEIITANEIHIPVGQPIELRLTSADVIHSFWVPSLAGKRDLNPGHENVIWIQADEPGVYWGQCAEFCGVQHALMAMLVVAEPAESFDEWVEQLAVVESGPEEQQLARGEEVFLEAGCALCHSIQGVADQSPTGPAGPDLTHLGSRSTLAAGIIENNPENLAQWILSPHSIKPGVRMPPSLIETEDLEALIAYLLSLE